MNSEPATTRPPGSAMSAVRISAIEHAIDGRFDPLGFDLQAE